MLPAKIWPSITNASARPEAVCVVLAEDFLEVHAGGSLVLAQQLHGGGARRGGNIAAIELGNRGNAAVGLDGDAHFFDIGGQGKSHVFLAGSVVGGGTALNIHGAVLHQGNAVLRCHRQVFDFQLFACGFFEVGNDVLAHLVVEAGVFAVAQGVGQRSRRVAYTHGDAARGLDLGNGVVCLGQPCGQKHGEGDELLFHEILLMDLRGRKG
jgi:hypothetical protein